MAENNENKGFLDDFEVDEETMREVELASKNKKPPRNRYKPPKKPTYSQVHRAKLRNMKIIIAVSWVLLAVLVGFGIYLTVMQVKSVNESAPRISSGQINEAYDQTVLLSLEDDVTGSWRRTFVLVRFDSKSGKTTVCSLPVGVKCTAGQRSGTLGEHYKYGGILQVKRAVSELAGVTVDKCWDSKYTDFDKILDKVGAVEYTIDKDMTEKGPNGEKYCDLKAGKQSLTAHQIYNFLTYRNGTLGEQSERNSKLLSCVFKKFLSPDMKTAFPELYKSTVNNVRTDIAMLDVNGFIDCFDKLVGGEVRACPINTVGDKAVVDSSSLDSLTQSFKD